MVDDSNPNQRDAFAPGDVSARDRSAHPPPDQQPATPKLAGSSASNPKAYETVLAWVEQRVLTGEFVVGTVLPAERDLAAHLHVSRSAVREAVRALSAMGVVESRVGAGSSGGTVVTAAASTALNRFLRMHVALAQFDLADVLDVRIALECLSVALAARNATAHDLDELSAIVHGMDSDELGIEDFNERDAEFHIRLAHLAGNVLARDLTIAIRESMKRPIKDGIEHVDDWPATRALLRRGHRDVLDAVRRGDAQQAAEAMRHHIVHAGRGLLRLPDSAE